MTQPLQIGKGAILGLHCYFKSKRCGLNVADILQMTCSNAHFYLSLYFSAKFVPNVQIHEGSTLVPVMGYKWSTSRTEMFFTNHKRWHIFFIHSNITDNTFKGFLSPGPPVQKRGLRWCSFSEIRTKGLKWKANLLSQHNVTLTYAANPIVIVCNEDDLKIFSCIMLTCLHEVISKYS